MPLNFLLFSGQKKRRPDRPEKQKKIILIKNKKIPYTLKRSYRARHLSISINSAGKISATLPNSISLSKLEGFMQSRSNWIQRTVSRVTRTPPSLLEQGTRDQFLKSKSVARRLVLAKIRHFNKYYQFQINRVFIRDQKSRWGSCSAKKNLNFNWRVVFLGQKHLDYLIVHELCHLEQLNHSPKFWQLVAKTIPQFKQTRKEMRQL
ncbi:MAG: M48 family metallopeptidase [Patescibacteria group bacterium]|nr:M48 family metallopeptidase [Patescibacteria group bacterium]